MHFRIGFFTLMLIATLFAAAYSTGSTKSVAQPVEQIMTPSALCTDLVAQAETAVGQLCNSLGRNVACYGNRTVSVAFRPNSNVQFNASGDIVNLLDVQSLSTTPLNPQTKDWGIAILKAQTNLPDALPGQNVTFVLFGDTTVDNPSPDMHAVTVSTRIGDPACVGAPNSALLIQAPEGTQVQMNLNGADLTLGSTAFITAVQNGDMAVAIIEGTGIVGVGGQVRVIPPGAQVRIPLGGTDGLRVSGPPSDVEPYDYDAMLAAPLSLLERPVSVPEPIGNLFATRAPTSTIAPCTPRSDWTFLYTVPFGDTLSGIASRIGLSTATLAAGNCITNANVLVAGQIIRAPVAVPVFVFKTRTPTLTPTVTGTPPTATSTATLVPPSANLSANPTTIYPNQCSTLSWSTANATSVTLNSASVAASGSMDVCPTTTTTYTLTATGAGGTASSSATVTFVTPVCGNGICEISETSDTCLADCG